MDPPFLLFAHNLTFSSSFHLLQGFGLTEAFLSVLLVLWLVLGIISILKTGIPYCVDNNKDKMPGQL